jgi:hypothetical protein
LVQAVQVVLELQASVVLVAQEEQEHLLQLQIPLQEILVQLRAVGAAVLQPPKLVVKPILLKAVAGAVAEHI